MKHQARYLPFGDRGLMVEYGNEIAPEISNQVRGLYVTVLNENLPGIISINPTYRSLLVEYDPSVIRFSEMVETLKKLEAKMEQIELPKPDIFEIPTLYGGEYGPDIETVASKNGLSQQEVIDIHTGTDYLVYMLGFTPGFSYLGGMDKRIETPRLATPRVKISGGSVGIAGSQTGFYSMDSPGGWQLIGRTPIKVYDPNRAKPILHKAGDYIRFIPITQEEYNKIEKEVAEGTYEYRIYPLGGKFTGYVELGPFDYTITLVEGE